MTRLFWRRLSYRIVTAYAAMLRDVVASRSLLLAGRSSSFFFFIEEKGKNTDTHGVSLL